jgi:AcrR family transcriptional regulator
MPYGCAVDDARRAILGAATRCFRRYGIQRTTVVDIAREAGVSRQTLYNQIPGGKDAIIAEVIVDEARRVNERARKRLDLDQPAADLLAHAHVELVLSARRSPYCEVLLDHGALGMTSGVIDRAAGVAAVMGEYWMPILERLRDAGDLREGLDLEEAVHWLTFVHVALVAQPGMFGGDAQTTRDLVRRYVVPVLTGTLDT